MWAVALALATYYTVALHTNLAADVAKLGVSRAHLTDRTFKAAPWKGSATAAASATPLSKRERKKALFDNRNETRSL